MLFWAPRKGPPAQSGAGATQMIEAAPRDSIRTGRRARAPGNQKLLLLRFSRVERAALKASRLQLRLAKSSRPIKYRAEFDLNFVSIWRRLRRRPFAPSRALFGGETRKVFRARQRRRRHGNRFPASGAHLCPPFGAARRRRRFTSVRGAALSAAFSPPDRGAAAQTR